VGERPGHRDRAIQARERARRGEHAEAAHLWAQVASQRPIGPARAEAFAEQAKLLGGPLSRPDDAFAAWRRAFLNDPARADVWDALEGEARRRGDWLLLAAVLRRRLVAALDPARRAEVACALGKLEVEQLHAPGAARRWFEAGLALAPSHPGLTEALAALDRHQNTTPARIELLERILDLRGREAHVEQRLEAAALQLERGDHARALAHLQLAAERAPDDVRVLEALLAPLEALDRPVELADLLTRLATLTQDASRRALLLARLGGLFEERLFDAEAALDAFLAAHAADPGAPGVAEALARLRAKRDPNAPAAPEPPAAQVRTPLEQLEREARTTSDRGRLAQLVREIESAYQNSEQPDGALPWVQRWVMLAPEDPNALRALARVHEALGRDSELCATLEMLDPLLPPGEQVANRRRMASLYRRRDRREDALRSYERALAVDPRDLESLEALAELQRARGPSIEVVRTLWRAAELHEPRRRALCLSEIALVQQELGDLGASIDTLLRLEREETAPADTQDRIEALLERTGRHEELEERLRTRAARHDPDSAESVALELRRARLLLDALGRTQEAADAYRNVLRYAPEAPDAKSGLERALRAGLDAAGLAEFLAEQSRDGSDPRSQERSQLERAVLLDELLGRGDEAREIYQALAREAVDAEIREEASDRYERMLDAGGEWELLRDHLDAKLAHGSAGSEVATHERLARLCGERLDDRNAELYHWEQIVARAPRRADVWHRLAERYEQDDRIEDAMRAMSAELGCAPDHTRAQTLLGRLADLALHTLGDEELAARHFERLFELNPAHPTAASFLIDKHRRGRRPEDVLRVLEARLASLDARRGDELSPEALRSHRTALRVHIARVREEVGDSEGAISALEVALGEEGPLSQIANPLAECYLRAGYSLDLIELCRAAASACDESAERAAWFVRLGDAFLSRDRPRDAADAYRHALTERPDDRALQACLRQIYRRISEPEPLARLLEAELAHLGGPDELPVRIELAELFAGTLARPEEALLHARRVLELSPHHTRAFEIATELSLRLERPQQALELADVRLAEARSDGERALLEVQRARLLAGSLARPDDAVAAYYRALELAPQARELRGELVALLERRERWDEVLSWLGRFAREAEGEARCGLLERAASIAWERLGPDGALPWLERLRLERPRDARVLTRIAEVHRRAGRREALLRVIESECELSDDATRRRDLHLERAKLLERVQPARALAAVEAAREALPGDTGVLERLEDLQRRLGRHAERARTIEALLASGSGDAIELNCRLAALYESSLGDADAALRHWRAALTRVPPGAAARAEILRCVAETQRRRGEKEAWADAAEAELVALRPEPVFDDRRRELRQQLAHAWFVDLNRPDAALRHLRALLDCGEDDLLGRETVARLERIALRALRAADLPVELEARMARHLGRCPDDVALWLELAALREDRLQSPSAALDAYKRAQALDPGSLGALHGLRRVAERLGRWQDVAESLERELAHPDTTRAGDRGALLRRLGDIYWHRLSSTTRASRCYAAALEANGRDLAALRALQRLLETMEDWRGALDLYESEIEVLGGADAPRRRSLWLRVSELARQRTDEIERARRAYARAASLGALDAKALRSWAELHERAGDREAFAEAFRAWCDAPDSRATAADQLRLARCLAEIGNHSDALARVSLALAADASLPGAWDLAAALRQTVGDVAGAAIALREAAAAQNDDAEAVTRLLAAARLQEPADPEGALATLREAARRSPSTPDAHAARARLAHALGRHAEAHEAAARALDLDVHARLGTGAAELAVLAGDAAREGGRLDDAVGFYERARTLRPDDPLALSRYGEALAALGDFASAREVLRARIERGDRYPERAAHRVLLGKCLEQLDALEEALASYRAALDESPAHDAAWQAVVAVHQALGNVDEGIDALERWSRVAPHPAERAARLLEAAEWELRSGSRDASAERHLRAAVAADPDLARAWHMLVSRLLAQGRVEAAIEAADRAAVHAAHDSEIGALALLQARAFEERGARPEAAEVYGLAAEADPRCAEAALSQARLLRGFGAWPAAAEALRVFLARHPDPASRTLAEVHEQLGRLLAGPLEDVDGAVLAYRRAIELVPERLSVRSALAELLSHRAGDAVEALSHLRPLLEANPADAACLRVALRIARTRGADARPGIAILHALGQASTYEVDEAGRAADWRPSAEPALADAHFETLRRLAGECADALASAIDASAPERRSHAAAPQGDAFRAARDRAEGELAAPALVGLSADEAGAWLRLLASVLLDPDSVHGDGRRVNALASELGRRLRRRVKKLLEGTTLRSVSETDFAAWQRELRALAGARVLAAGTADLRGALVSLVREDAAGPPLEARDGDDIGARVAASPLALALLRRIVRDWLVRFGDAR
jgi:tetratricopeptide (TPR) repeat protein